MNGKQDVVPQRLFPEQALKRIRSPSRRRGTPFSFMTLAAMTSTREGTRGKAMTVLNRALGPFEPSNSSTISGTVASPCPESAASTSRLSAE